MPRLKKCLGFNIKTIRQQRGLTQEALSEMVMVNPNQLSKIETGFYFPSYVTLKKLSIALNVEPKQMFDFKFLDSNYDNENEYIKLIQEMRKYSNDKFIMTFMKVALHALKSDENLKTLDTMIQGIKLSKRIE